MLSRAPIGCWGALLLAGSHAAGQAQTSAVTPRTTLPPRCHFDRPARVVTSLSNLPEVADEFRRQKIVVADRGEPFRPYDVIANDSPAASRQFQRAYVFADRTVVWYWHGGFVSHLHVIELRRQRDVGRSTSTLHLTGIRLTGEPCRATQAILDGIRDLSDW